MAHAKIIAEEPITMDQLKGELASIKTRDKELGYRSAKSEEYLSHFTKVKDTEDILKKIDKLQIPRLKTNHVVKIIDLMPKTVDDVKLILQAYTLTVNNDNVKKILEVLEKYQ